jgi:hypothetical protein
MNILLYLNNLIYYLTASLRVFQALNTGDLIAGIFIDCLVLGFTPFLAAL